MCHTDTDHTTHGADSDTTCDRQTSDYLEGLHLLSPFVVSAAIRHRCTTESEPNVLVVPLHLRQETCELAATSL
jgi:hypothetical protein